MNVTDTSITSDNETIGDIAVIGGGPAGLAMALALGLRGREVSVFGPDLEFSAPSHSVRDTRTTAVLGDGITLLQNLGVWPALAPVSAALTAIRIIDDRRGFLTAPQVLFQAQELGRTAFGWNVPNDQLRRALLERAAAHDRITLKPTRSVVDVVPGSASVALRTAEGWTSLARLVVAADGRHSLARAAAGITVRSWDYPQVAVVTDFGHARPHGGVSTELHRRHGPLTTVPLPDDADGPRSSLVWIETPADAERLKSLSDADFIAELLSHLLPLTGPIRNIGVRGSYPIRGLMANASGKGRIVLAGEAAHVVSPMGAQGLNLGLRDAAALADALGATNDPGAPSVIEAYARARAADLASREIGVDLLNRSLLTDFFPVQAARGLTLHALANSRTLRRAAMHMGLAAPGPVPSLMQPLATCR